MGLLNYQLKTHSSHVFPPNIRNGSNHLNKIRMPIIETTVREVGSNNDDLERHLDCVNEEKEIVVI